MTPPRAGRQGNGVDLNRNFDWQFGGPGSSAEPKNEVRAAWPARPPPAMRPWVAGGNSYGRRGA